MVVVSVRVDDQLKKRLQQAGIDVPLEVRRHLQELDWQIELKERLGRLERALADMPPTPKGYSAKSVREDRESH